MTRLRWFAVTPAAQLLGALGRTISTERFGPDLDAGFIADSVSRTRISAAYVERLPFEDRVEDPFGNVSLYRRVEYRRTEFTLSTDFPQLQIRNAPRTLRPFFARLGEIGGHDFTVEGVELDVLRVVAAVEKAVGRVTVPRLVVSNVPLSPRASAEFLVSGAGDVRDEAKKFTSSRLATVTAATVKWERRTKDVECVVTRTSISCEADGSDTVERLLKDVVRDLPQQGTAKAR